MTFDGCCFFLLKSPQLSKAFVNQLVHIITLRMLRPPRGEHGEFFIEPVYFLSPNPMVGTCCGIGLRETPRTCRDPVLVKFLCIKLPLRVHETTTMK
jgi:hypothetical protein